MILEKFLGNSSKKVTTVGEFGEIYSSLLLLGKTRGKSLWKGEGKRKRGDYRGDRIPRYIVLLVSNC